jgi:hypothetical protein
MIKEGMKCRIRNIDNKHHMREGMIYKINPDSIDVYFDEGEVVEFYYGEVFLPLHDGVFLENERPADWFAAMTAAKIKIHANLVAGAIEKFEDLTKLDLPDEILNALKKIIDVLGSKEGLALIKFLFAVI